MPTGRSNQYETRALHESSCSKLLVFYSGFGRITLFCNFFVFQKRKSSFFFLEFNVLFKTRSIFNSLIFFQGEFAYEGQIYTLLALRDSSRLSSVSLCVCVCVCIFFKKLFTRTSFTKSYPDLMICPRY